MLQQRHNFPSVILNKIGIIQGKKKDLKNAKLQNQLQLMLFLLL